MSLAWAALVVAVLAWAGASAWIGRARDGGRPARAIAVWARALAWALAGAGWAAVVAHAALADRLDPALEARDLVVEGVIEGLPQRAEHGWTARLAIERSIEPKGLRLPAAVRLTFADPRPGAPAPEAAATQPRAGERWRLPVRLRPAHASSNPHAFDAELRLLEEGIGAVGAVRPARGADEAAAGARRIDPLAATPSAWLGRARERLRDAVLEAAGPSHPTGRGMLVALVVGDQAALGSEVWEAFNRTGVGHLMSISGLHITMLAALGAAAAGWAWRRRLVARLGGPLWVPVQRVRLAGAVAAAGAYSLLAGWGIPAQRTFWMLAAAALALAAGRSSSVPASLAVAAGVVTLLDPWAPLAAGFWLSFGAVAAIVWAMQRGAPRAPRSDDLRTRLRERLCTTLAAAAGTQAAVTVALVPLSVAFFGSVSLVGPLVNAAAIPLVAGLLTPAGLAGAAIAAVSPAAGAWLLGPCAQAAEAIARGLLSLADWSWAAWPVARPGAAALLLGVAGTAWLLAPRALPLRAAAGCALLPLVLAPPERLPDGELRITALDVGQGTAVLVQAGDRALLYDAGPAWAGGDAGARIVVPHLRALGIARLDVLVVSHPDQDHAGGVPGLLRAVAADRVLSSLPDDHPALRQAASRGRCVRGEGWQWGEVRFEWLHPAEEDPAMRAKSATNAASCVLRVQAPGGALLLTGDIEAAQEARIAARTPPDRLRAQVLVTPHHGSRTSSSEAFLRAVDPQWSVVQAGWRSRFGHPHPAVVARHDELGIGLLRTDRDGAITLRLRPGEPPTIERDRTDRPRYWRVPWTEPPARR